MHTTEQLNTALSGRYEIDRRIGEGGMATVYLARDVRHNRKVALKVLKPDLGAVVGVERFLSEIQVTANLQHPHLLPLFDSGGANGLLFYVMPYVEGESLRARLNREKQLPIDETVRLTTAIASALSYAHRHGVIHRDLKPENILLHEGQPLVADFGIALAVRNAGGNRITATGLSLGTPQYMSPEQATGDRDIDARTDIYSLGAVAYEMLTGDPPHTGSTSQAVIARVLTETPRAMRLTRPTVPPHVEGAVMQALAKLPADRWTSAQEFSDALTGARAVTPSAQVNAWSGISPAPAARRFGLREMIAWGLLVAIGSWAGWSATRKAPTPVVGRFQLLLPDSVTINPFAGPNLALSRDGAQLVVVGVKGTERSLYVRRLDDPVAQQVRGTDSATVPSFSPDGRWILFRSAGKLLKVPTVGGTPQMVSDSINNEAASWGDGGNVVFVKGAGVLWMASADGGTPRLLARPDSARQLLRYLYPEVLPGGRSALITIYRGAVTSDSSTLGVVSLADGKVTDLNMPGRNPHYVAPGYVLFGRPSGLVFAAPFSLGSSSITGTPRLLLEGVAQSTSTRFEVAAAQVGTLAYVGGMSVSLSAMYAVDRRGAERQLTRDLRQYWDPRVSPDGRHIVVRIGTTVFTGDLWIFDLATRALTRITADSNNIRPEWTRDGSRIVYSVRKGPNTDHISSRRWDRPDTETVLSRAPGVQEVAVGPIHGFSALRQGGSDENPNIMLAPTDSLSAMRPFITTPPDEHGPRVSPNGRLLAYSSNETGRREIYLVQIPGPGPRVQVSIDGGDEAMWSPDGATVYYRGPVRMMAATVVERPALAVTRRDSLFVDAYDRYSPHQAYDVFPNGREFLLTKGPAASFALYVIVNWPQLIGTKGAVAEGN